MDARMVSLLRSLLLNIEVLNAELRRLQRTEQFVPTSDCLQLCEQLREDYMQGLETLRSVENLLRQKIHPR